MPRDPYEHARRRMVEKHIASRGVRDPRVLDVMGQVPRHLFVREHYRTQAYRDFALPIEREQTISQPYIVARMTELLDLDPEHSVLEIGTGSGYQTVVLAYLARRVYSLERVAELARRAIERVRVFELDNVKIQAFDGTVGWSDVAPFDRILVTAAAPGAPQPLVDQLVPGGKMVIPEGDRNAQNLVIYHKQDDGTLRRHVGEAVAFVPLIGRHGWTADQDQPIRQI
ncbi:MAG: protein-L-isoaspartate(D-aspartate) O-methyltransferase [Acidobacteriota bacterium]